MNYFSDNNAHMHREQFEFAFIIIICEKLAQFKYFIVFF